MMSRLVSTVLLLLLASTASTSPVSTRNLVQSPPGAGRYDPLIAAVEKRSSQGSVVSRGFERLRLRRTVRSPDAAQPSLAKRVLNPKNVQLDKRAFPVSQPVIRRTKPEFLLAQAAKESPFIGPAKRSNTNVITNPKAARSLPVRRSSVLRRTIDLFSGSIGKITAPVGPAVLKRQVILLRVVPNPKGSNYAAVLASLTQSLPTSTKSVPVSTKGTPTTTLLATTSTIMLSTSTITASTTSTTSLAMASTSTSTSTAPSSTGTSWPSSGGMVAGAYYADWTAGRVPPSSIPYAMFDVLHFSFAVPTNDLNIQFTQDDDALLSETITRAHAANTKVLITIGGWADSGKFSNCVSSSSKRATFAANIKAFVDKYGADGVDIDWEYPGTQGAEGNVVSSSDTANFLAFLQQLRKLFGTTLRITTATTQQPFIGSNGSPLTDVAAFAAVLDGVMVMNYDVWGASSTPGPNAPLTNACPNSQQPNANMLSAIQTWEAAGMPASKILMGVPAYGYVSSSSATSLIHKRDTRDMSSREVARHLHKESYMSFGHRMFLQAKRQQAKEAAVLRARKAAERKAIAAQLAKRQAVIYCPNNHSGKPCPGVTGQNISEINWYPLNNGTSTNGTFNGGIGGVKIGNGDVSSLDGNQIEYYQLVDYGVLAKSGTEYVGANGYTRAWDSCSSTPYVYSQSRNVVITYDDPDSMYAKGNLAKQQGIAGMLVWELSGDTSDYVLAQSWRNGMGLVPLG